MKKLSLLLIVFIVALSAKSQNVVDKSHHDPIIKNNYTAYFNEAYQQFPDIPHGLLEAVSFTQTRFHNIQHPAGAPESCMGVPKAYGVMGLTLNGKNYFKNNLVIISHLTGYSVNDIIHHPEINILAYAKAFSIIKQQKHISSNQIEDQAPVLDALTELPANTNGQRFARDSYVYEVYDFLNSPKYQALYQLPAYKIDFLKIFSKANFKVLSSTKVKMGASEITSTTGQTYRSSAPPQTQATDYPGAIWNPAASCNYTVGRTQAISAVVIHDVEGTYAGCISWFQNCNSQVSAHYVVRSSDGQITQMVREADKAWHVGSENPYTIGIEHEGYQAQTGWYTTAMYTQSAALVRDICNSGYGIPPYRCGFWPWLATTYYNQSGIPGTCTQIKGHQHYPNQTHTDPGPNWDWDYYYKLVNQNPAVTTYTTATGNFYDTGGATGNYSNDERKVWVISPANATSVTINFSSFSVENTWDYMYIYDGNSIWAPLIGYYTGTNSPGTITSSGGALTIEFRSDCATNSTGWAANWTSTTSVAQNADSIAPTTWVNAPNSWETQSFTTNFTDSDNTGGSGLDKSFYQVLEYNGYQWGANYNNGFFSDNFDSTAINPEWTSVTGTWSIDTAGGYLQQSDETLGNTNIYAPLKQNLSNRYLYAWSGKINGTGTNRRAGFHFFCDNPTLTNRGNSYFVWFRVDQEHLQFYKVVNDTFNLESQDTISIQAGQWYSYQVMYDRISGKIAVYINNSLVSSWTDPSPYSNGGYVSFRSGNSNYEVNNFKVYRSRYPSVTVSVGPGSTNDIRYQNTNPTTPAGRVKSIVVDSAGNLSAVSYQDINVDWTPPTNVSTVNDGIGADIDTTSSASTLSATWTASQDTNSDVVNYIYCFGTTPGDSDVVPWTGSVGDTTVTVNGLSLINNQLYYCSVKAVDGAGLISSAMKTSNGQRVVTVTTDAPSLSNNNTFIIFPNPFNNSATVKYNLTKAEQVRIVLYDVLGKEVRLYNHQQEAGMHQYVIHATDAELSPGVYFVKLTMGNTQKVAKLIYQ